MDRRVERTQQLIRQALLSLIQEKGFEALTVQEIIDRANVGRATFYAHFDNKDDLLVSGFEELRASLKARQRDAFARGRTTEERVFAFSEEMFAHANEYRDVFRAMVGKKSGATVRRMLHKLLVDLVRDDVKGTVARTDSNAVPTESPRAVHRQRPVRPAHVVDRRKDAAVSRRDQRAVPQARDPGHRDCAGQVGRGLP
jgi:AcrR family transcriptional regulator